jgi:hypothetical protein
MNNFFKYRLSQKWWFNSTRYYTWFSFRYWWVNYLFWIVLISILVWILLKMNDLFSDCPEQQEVNALMRKIDRDLENCCDCKMSTPFIPTPPVSVRDSLGENEHYLPADYIVITYQFDASGGKDLDTRTNVVQPFQSATLGYCKSQSTEGIVWSGDNVNYGVESVYIDLNYFGVTDKIKVLTKAFWFSYRRSGDMSLDVRAYKGGAMNRSSIDRFQFVNEGGYQVGNVLSFNKNIVVKDGCCEGETVGSIAYDRQRQVLSFE